MKKMKFVTWMMLGFIALPVGSVAFADEADSIEPNANTGKKVDVEYEMQSSYTYHIPEKITLHDTDEVMTDVTIDHNLGHLKSVNISLSGTFSKGTLTLKDKTFLSSRKIETKVTTISGKTLNAINLSFMKVTGADKNYEPGTAKETLTFSPVGKVKAGQYTTQLTFIVTAL